MLHVADAPPFPAQGEAGTSAAEGTSEALLQKSDLHRFGASGAYRDVPFAILFGTHLLGVVVIAAANGSSVWSISSGSVAPRSDAGARYHQLIAILAVIIHEILVNTSAYSGLVKLFRVLNGSTVFP